MNTSELLQTLRGALERYSADALCAHLCDQLPAALERLSWAGAEGATLVDLEGRDDLLRARLVRLLRAGLCALWRVGEQRAVFVVERELRRADAAWCARWHERLQASEARGGQGWGFARWCEGEVWAVKW